ncbi:6663_t:CDS:2 [Cetraspora pellucida]|uniref:6663_t:CDS:1 n=1 Tax=Cetraspora pellucida TaxID=1433469 RepID=A0ACA9KED4_9GLOM|nr:6663_t:CDS:2 [Cetraspora pellucida]
MKTIDGINANDEVDKIITYRKLITRHLRPKIELTANEGYIEYAGWHKVFIRNKDDEVFCEWKNHALKEKELLDNFHQRWEVLPKYTPIVINETYFNDLGYREFIKWIIKHSDFIPGEKQFPLGIKPAVNCTFETWKLHMEQIAKQMSAAPSLIWTNEDDKFQRYLADPQTIIQRCGRATRSSLCLQHCKALYTMIENGGVKAELILLNDEKDTIDTTMKCETNTWFISDNYVHSCHM